MREILEKVFGIVCNLSLVGSYCILLVLVARLVLRRAPRWCSYLLWGIVFLRLCCPIFPQTQISLIPQRLVMGQTVSAPLKVPRMREMPEKKQPWNIQPRKQYRFQA